MIKRTFIIAWIGVSLLIGLSACSSATPVADLPTDTRTAPPPTLTETALPSATPLPPTETPTETPLPTATVTESPTPTQTPSLTPTPEPTDTPEPTATNTAVPQLTFDESILMYFVHVGTGGPVACGDSLVAYRTGFVKTGNIAADVQTGLNALWQQAPYRDGLYNATSTSRLQVTRVEFDPYAQDMGVYVTGSFVPPTDSCEKLRYNAQIRATALQFGGVSMLRFWLDNGLLLGDLLCVQC